MTHQHPPRSYLCASILLFWASAAIAIFLLLIALIVWMTYLTGSLIAATLIAGSFFAALSWVIYWFSIRQAIHHFWDQLRTIYEVAHAAQTGYVWLIDKLNLFMTTHSK